MNNPKIILNLKSLFLVAIFIASGLSIWNCNSTDSPVTRELTLNTLSDTAITKVEYIAEYKGKTIILLQWEKNSGKKYPGSIIIPDSIQGPYKLTRLVYKGDRIDQAQTLQMDGVKNQGNPETRLDLITKIDSLLIDTSEAPIAIEGSDYVFQPRIKKTRAVNFAWSKNGQPFSNDSVLTLKNVKLSDSGTYTLTISAVNAISAARSFTLKIQSGVPVVKIDTLFIDPIETRYAFEGRDYIFQPSIKGKMVTYTWLKNGQPFGNDSVLSLKNAKHSDSGTYTVTISAVNAIAASRSFSLKIQSGKFRIEVTIVGKGKVNDSSQNFVDDVASGGQIIYKYLPSLGYQLDTLLRDHVADNNAKQTLTSLFEKIDSNHTIKAIFKPILCTLDLSTKFPLLGSVSATGTKISNEGNKSVFAFGEKVIIEAKVNANYRFIGWTKDTSSTIPLCTLSMKKNYTIEAQFAPIDLYAITVKADSGNKVRLEEDKKGYTKGEVVKFTAEAIKGWKFVAWEGDITGTTNPMSYTVIDKDIKVSARFERELFSVLTFANPVGAGVPVASTPVAAGVKTNINANPALSHLFQKWVKKGGSGTVLFGDSSQASTTMIVENGNVEIEAQYNLKKFKIGLSATVGGILSPSQDSTVFFDSSLSIKVTSNEGYEVSEILIDNVADATAKLIVNSTGIYDFKQVRAPHSFKALFVKRKYSFSATSNDANMGSVTVTPSSTTFEHGSVVKVQAVVKSGYKFNGWSGETGFVDADLNITMTKPINIVAQFSRFDNFSLVLNADSGNTIEASPKKSNYTLDDSVTLTAKPIDAGWEFSAWSGDLTGTLNPIGYRVKKNMSVTAVFVRKKYTLSLSVNNSTAGSVIQTPSGTSFSHGTVIKFEAKPNSAEGYYFSSWSNALTGNNLSTSIVMDGTKTVEAIFLKSKFKVSIEPVTVGQGSITKDIAADSVDWGTNVKFTAVAGTDYLFGAWTGISASVNPATVSVKSNLSIGATFNLIPQTAPISTFSPASGSIITGTTNVIITGPASSTIYYTTNGSDPTKSSTSGPSPLSVSISASTTIKAAAFQSGKRLSDVAIANYVKNNLPTVAITAPANNAKFSFYSDINITANATDLDGNGTITSVSFYDDATLLAKVTTAPFTFKFLRPTAGTHLLKAKVVDDKNSEAWHQVNVSVDYDIISDRIAVKNIIDSNQMTGLTISDICYEVNGRIRTLELAKNNLTGKKFTKLPLDIQYLTELDTLYGKEEAITNFPSALTKLKKLKLLDLSTNLITTLPDNIGDLTSLEEISLGENKFLVLPSSFYSLTNLTLISLNSCGISFVSSAIANFKNLVILYLYNNSITSIPKEIGMLTNLTSLYLFENKINLIPTQIGNLANLKVLTLSNNLIERLPFELGNLKKLYVFSFSNNKIAYIEDGVTNIELQSHPGKDFNVSNNQLCQDYNQTVIDWLDLNQYDWRDTQCK